MSQIFGNLLTNASKFSGPGVEIGLAVRQWDGVAEVTVSDTGIGIARELLPKVFDMFARGDRGPELDHHSGLGIGLPLVKRLVEMHGGTVQASSAGTGQGSTFVVRLPVATATAVDG